MTTNPESPSLGPHGGPLIAIADGRVEISVFETNSPPHFRLYFFDQKNQPQAQSSETLTIETVRPLGGHQVFALRARDGFLESTSAIPEPHEFEVILTVTEGGERHAYTTRFTEQAHGHAHDTSGHHGHTHGLVDPTITTSDQGLRATKWSFVALIVTASLQLVVVILSHSVALLADTIHNFGDAATAIPLGIAFTLARRPPSRRFTYGLGRVEDLAGLAVVLTILTSAIVAGYLGIQRLLHPHDVTNLGAIVVASIIGFVGNEGVAIFRIKVGKEIGSAALIADGYHARTDGWTSLAVLLGALGVHFGYPIADPLIGLVITAAILGIVWESVKAVLSRMLDGVEPDVIDQVRGTAANVRGVVAVTDVRARWIGHQLRAEVNVAVAPDLTVAASHIIAKEVGHQLQHHLKFLGGTVIHVDPSTETGEAQHHSGPHEHDGLEPHAH